MHKVLKAFPCSFDGIHSVDLQVDDKRDFGSMAAGLKKAGLIGDIDGKEKSPADTELRDDGPTVAEYVAKGYLAANYPPKGYASRSTREEIDAAIEAQKVSGGDDDAAKIEAALRTELAKLTVAQLREKAAGLNIQIADDAKKDDIIEALTVAASAPQA